MPADVEYLEYGNYRIALTRRLTAKRTTLKVGKNGEISITTSVFEPKSRILRFVRDNEAFLQRSLKKIENNKKKNAVIDFEANGKGYLLGNPINTVNIEHNQSKCWLDNDTLYIQGKSKDARERAFRKFAQDILDNFIDQFRYELLYAVPDYVLKYRFYKSRWGCCIKNERQGRREVVMNLWCVAMPREAIRYIFYHELAHLWVSNHQKEFYRQLSILCPDYKKGQKISKEYMIGG